MNETSTFKRFVAGREPGFYEGVPMPLYRELPGLSSHEMMAFRISPAHSKAYRERPRDEKVRDGSVIHAMVFEPDNALKYYEPIGDLRSKENKAIYEKAMALGKERVTPEQWDRCRLVADAIKSKVRFNFPTEVTALAEYDGLPLKARFDAFDHDNKIIYDLKTIGFGLSDFALQAMIWKHQWHIQAAFYTFVAGLVEPGLYKWKFVFAEDRPPYSVRVRSADVMLMDKAWDQIRDGFSEYKTCLNEGKWPGPEDLEGGADIEIGLPSYAVGDAAAIGLIEGDYENDYR